MNPGKSRQLQALTSESSFCFSFVLFFCCCYDLSRLFSFFHCGKRWVLFSLRPQNVEDHIKGYIGRVGKYFAHQPLSVPQILQVKNNAFQQVMLVYNWITVCKRMKLGPYLIQYTIYKN